MKIMLPAVRAGSGSDVYTERLAAGLKRAGHEVIVKWFPHSYELTPWRLKRFSIPDGVDIIHCNSWQGFAFKRAGIPLVVTEHHFVLDPKFTPYRSFLQKIYHELFIAQCLKRSYKSADAIIAVSHHTARAVEKKFDYPITVIYNWLNVEYYRKALPKQPDTDRADTPFRLLFVGNPSSRKGTDLLHDLARNLGKGFEIWCMGGLRKEFQSKRRPDNLIPIPSVKPNEMPKVYAKVDAVLILARYEAFGYVALEAMACEKPVVGFNNTGIGEICINEETALLCATDNLDQLVQACIRLKQNRSLVARLSKNSLNLALGKFDETNSISTYIQLYQRLRKKPRGKTD